MVVLSTLEKPFNLTIVGMLETFWFSVQNSKKIWTGSIGRFKSFNVAYITFHKDIFKPHLKQGKIGEVNRRQRCPVSCMSFSFLKGQIFKITSKPCRKQRLREFNLWDKNNNTNVNSIIKSISGFICN